MNATIPFYGPDTSVDYLRRRVETICRTRRSRPKRNISVVIRKVTPGCAHAANLQPGYFIPSVADLNEELGRLRHDTTLHRVLAQATAGGKLAEWEGVFFSRATSEEEAQAIEIMNSMEYPEV